MNKNQAKKERNEMRRQLLIKLLNEKYKGIQAKLAEDAEIPESYLSRMLYPEGKTQKKSITEGMIEKIENGCEVPGWFSNKGSNEIPEIVTKKSENIPGYILFDLLDIQVAAGRDLIVQDYPDVVQQMHILESWATKKLGGDLSRIKLMTAKGISMEGTIENGDILFIDSSIRTYDGEGIYVIWSPENGPQVKRLQKLQGNRLAVISDNKNFETEYLTKETANSLIIYGRVLASWSLKKMW